jgi:hypothetical protein
MCLWGRRGYVTSFAASSMSMLQLGPWVLLSAETFVFECPPGLFLPGNQVMNLKG